MGSNPPPDTCRGNLGECFAVSVVLWQRNVHFITQLCQGDNPVEPAPIVAGNTCLDVVVALMRHGGELLATVTSLLVFSGLMWVYASGWAATEALWWDYGSF